MSYSIKSILILCLAALLFSCKDDETPDTTGPDFIAVSPADNTKVNATLTITAEVEDISDEVNIQVFIDEVISKEEKTKKIVATVNTKIMSEGTHTVKVVATDKAGNATTKTFTIEVRNILFKLQITPSYVDPGTIVYHSLSRNDGTLIALYKAENGKAISINTPDDFNADSSFVFSQYFFLEDPYTLVHGVTHYADIKAGEFTFPYAASRALEGKHHLSISDIPSTPIHLGRHAGDNTWTTYGYFGDADPILSDVYMTSASSDLLISFYEDSNTMPAPLYKYLSSIQVDGSTSLSYKDFQPMTKATVALGEPLSYNLTIEGLKNSNSRGVAVFQREGTSTDSNMPLYYPGTLYPNYRFSIRSGMYSNVIIAPTPPTVLRKINAELKTLTYSNRKLKITSTGDFDMISVGASTYQNEGTVFKFNYTAVWFQAGTTHSITLPEIPQEVASLNFTMPTQKTEFNYGSATEFAALSGQSDYQSKIVFSSDQKFFSERESYEKTLVFPTTGGRASSNEIPASLKSKLSKYFPLLK